MEALGVKNTIAGKKGSSPRRSKKDLKVTYISSPIKVKTSASEFRALVQELTGKDSDIADSHFGDYDPGNSNTYSRSSIVVREVGDRGTTDQYYRQDPSAWVGSEFEPFGRDREVALPEIDGQFEAGGSYMDLLSSSFYQHQQESCFGVSS